MNRYDTFIEKLYECNMHKKRLLQAKEMLKGIIPLSINRYQHLEPIKISVIDQMIFRFSKLQDTMGEKVFPAILLLSGEEIKRMTFIDRLNRLEELELVDKDRWMKLRKERNEIAHEYSYNIEEVVEGINHIYKKIDELVEIFDKICNFTLEKFPNIGDRIKKVCKE